MIRTFESTPDASPATSTAMLGLPDAQLLPVPQALRTWIGSIWCANLAAGQEVHTLPDGSVDIVSVIDQPGARPVTFVSGPLRCYARHQNASARHLVGISLQPAAAGLLGIQAHELDDAWQPLRDLGLADAAPLFAAEPSDALAALCQFVQARAARVRVEPRVALAVQSLLTRGGVSHVEQLAREQRVSERTLLRLFERHLGLAPKQFARIVRFQRVLASCKSARVYSLADLALDAGYADQAHLTREVRALGGLTPGELLRDLRR